jgi:N-methylhydantoinase A/oxoprolinase/acetone carboxylase beta subunit
VNQSYSLAIDIGGTFTDLVLLSSNLEHLAVNKILTSYPDPSNAVLEGLGRLLSNEDVDPRSVGRLIHGTTLVTNTLIERKGARTGLITTRGFRDALEIGREGRYDIYDLFLELPEPLVERRLRLEAGGRLNVRGEVIDPLIDEDVEEACRRFLQAEVEAVAICFLHAYANPDHEMSAAEIVRRMMPDTALSLSHEVAPELREFDRTSTVVANAYVQPLAERYMRGLEMGLLEVGVKAPLQIMLSNGGICSAETASAFPVRLVESGPCGGALASAYWAKQTSRHKVLAFDMGGTTAKAILGDEQGFPITTESEVARVYRFKRGSGLPLLVPVMEMIEIGAGGGSIAHLNDLGLPTVGPESAGSDPGPACYGQGGVNPTVTDADLFLGLLNPDYFLGGEMVLDVKAANDALEILGRKLDMTPERMASGIHRMVNENMANAARVHAAERGIDIRRYTMVATGGAGPVHACGVAERLGIRTVIVPPVAGVGSAFGMMLAPISFDFSRSHVVRLEHLDFDRLNRLFAEMEAAGVDVVTEAGVEKPEIRIERLADVRYVGQGHEIRIVVPNDELDSSARERIRQAFEAEYTRVYGRICEGLDIETVHWRVRVHGPDPDLGMVRAPMRTEGVSSLRGTRQALFDAQKGAEETRVFDRYGLQPGVVINGPAIIEEAESTTVIGPLWSAEVHASGSLVLSREREK